MDLDHVKAIPITEVAQRLGLEVRNNRMRCFYPQNHAHGDRTPSISLSLERNRYRCWVCESVKGDAIDLVRQVQGCGFSEAIQWLESHFQVSTKRGQKFKNYPASFSKQPAGESKEQQSNSSVPSPETNDAELENKRLDILRSFFKHCVAPEGREERYLNRRRIFRKTIQSCKVRMVGNYQAMESAMLRRFSLHELQEAGLFSQRGHLRYYRHCLIFPYWRIQDGEVQVFWLQARAMDSTVEPKELSHKGPAPFPFNVHLLDQKPGVLYLCEGAIDALSMVQNGLDAVGVPGVSAFRQEWVPLFQNKMVYVAFDADTAGEKGAQRVLQLFAQSGIEARRIQIPKGGNDVNESFGGWA